MRIACLPLLLSALMLATPALAVDDRFVKSAANPKYGFLKVTDASYRKECGACHFAYSPGMLTSDAWRLVMEAPNLAKHFGEEVKITPAQRESLLRYLTENAAERSDYEGSKVFMERMSERKSTSQRVITVPHMATVHRSLWEIMKKSNTVQVRTLANCNACHQKAEEGSYAYEEILVPGLTSSWGATLK